MKKRGGAPRAESHDEELERTYPLLLQRKAEARQLQQQKEMQAFMTCKAENGEPRACAPGDSVQVRIWGDLDKGTWHDGQVEAVLAEGEGGEWVKKGFLSVSYRTHPDSPIFSKTKAFDPRIDVRQATEQMREAAAEVVEAVAAGKAEEEKRRKAEEEAASIALARRLQQEDLAAQQPERRPEQRLEPGPALRVGAIALREKPLESLGLAAQYLKSIWFS